MAITKEELKELAIESKKTVEVAIPSFVNGKDDITVEVNPNIDLQEIFMNGLDVSGLSEEAVKEFNDKDMTKEEIAKSLDADDIKSMLPLMKKIAEKSMVNPTYEDMKELGLELRTGQLLAIYTRIAEGSDDLKK